MLLPERNRNYNLAGFGESQRATREPWFSEMLSTCSDHQPYSHWWGPSALAQKRVLPHSHALKTSGSTAPNHHGHKELLPTSPTRRPGRAGVPSSALAPPRGTNSDKAIRGPEGTLWKALRLQAEVAAYSSPSLLK